MTSEVEEVFSAEGLNILPHPREKPGDPDSRPWQSSPDQGADRHRVQYRQYPSGMQHSWCLSPPPFIPFPPVSWPDIAILAGMTSELYVHV